MDNASTVSSVAAPAGSTEQGETVAGSGQASARRLPPGMFLSQPAQFGPGWEHTLSLNPKHWKYFESAGRKKGKLKYTHSSVSDMRAAKSLGAMANSNTRTLR